MLLTLLCLPIAGGSQAQAVDAPLRAALVVGNAAYPDSDAPLPTPLGDEQHMADALTRDGFLVEVAVNATKARLAAAVDHVLATVKPGSTVVVFFAGHGIQVAGKNYLIPVDSKIWNEADVIRDGLSVDRLVSDIASHGAKAVAIMLDAARRNPFERRFRSVPAGLAPLAAAPGTLSISATAPGTLIDDAPGGPGGLFATELVRAIGMPGLDAEQAFAQCRDAVSVKTDSQQNPAVVSGLDEAFSFQPVQPSAVTSVAPPDPSPVSAAPISAAPISAAPISAAPISAAPVSAAAAASPAAQVEPVGPEPPVVESRPAPAPPAGDPVAPPAAPLAKVAQRAAPQPASPPPQQTASLPPAAPAAPAASPPAVTRVEPATPPAATTLSSAESQQKAALDDRIARDPGDEAAFFERGRLMALHGDYSLALADFDRSISLDPKDAGAFNNRCFTRALMDQLQTAMDDCNQALKLRSNYADAHDSRGLVLLKRGIPRAALLDYDAALKIDPKHGSALYGRGLAKLRLGRNEDAERDIASAIALDHDIEREYALYGLK